MAARTLWLVLLVVAAAVELPATVEDDSGVVMLEMSRDEEQREGAGLFNTRHTKPARTRSHGLGYVKHPAKPAAGVKTAAIPAAPPATKTVVKTAAAPAAKAEHASAVDHAVQIALSAEGSTAQIARQIKSAVDGAVVQAQKQENMRKQIKTAVEGAVQAAKGHPDKASVDSAVKAAVSSTLQARGVGLTETGQAAVDALVKQVGVSKQDAQHTALEAVSLKKEMAKTLHSKQYHSDKAAQDHTVWDSISEQLKEMQSPLAAEEKLESKTAATATQDVKTVKSPMAQKFASTVAQDHADDAKKTKSIQLQAIAAGRIVDDVERSFTQQSGELGEGQELDARFYDPMSDLSSAQKSLEREMQHVEQASLAAEARKYSERIDDRKSKAASVPAATAAAPEPVPNSAAKAKSASVPAAAPAAPAAAPSTEPITKVNPVTAPAASVPAKTKAAAHSPTVVKNLSQDETAVKKQSRAKVGIDMPMIEASLTKSFDQVEKFSEEISHRDDNEIAHVQNRIVVSRKL